MDLKTISGFLMMMAIVSFIVCVVDAVAISNRRRKSTSETSIKTKPKPVWLVALAVLVVSVVGAIVTQNLGDEAQRKKETEREQSRLESLQAQSDVPKEPTRYEKMTDEIKAYLYAHNDTSSNFDSVEVDSYNGETRFTIMLPAYETYTFAAVTYSADKIISDVVDKYEVGDYMLWVSSPFDAKYKISWISHKPGVGLLTDEQPNDKYTEMVSVDFMAEKYGYEDYEGNLSDFLKNQNSTTS